MSFRQAKSHRQQHQREWETWLSRHEPVLKALGLPLSVRLTVDHWRDFLQNGYLERHPESFDGFTIDRLSREQMLGLLQVLDASPEYAPEPMTVWLRHRLGGAGDARLP